MHLIKQVTFYGSVRRGRIRVSAGAMISDDMLISEYGYG